MVSFSTVGYTQVLNKGSLCVCVVAVVLVYIGMYAALCKEIGNIIVGGCGA